MIGHHGQVDEAQLELSVVGEAPADLVELVAGGLAVLLTRSGLPALVVVDVDTWSEVEQLVEVAS